MPVEVIRPSISTRLLTPQQVVEIARPGRYSCSGGTEIAVESRKKTGNPANDLQKILELKDETRYTQTAATGYPVKAVPESNSAGGKR